MIRTSCCSISTSRTARTGFSVAVRLNDLGVPCLFVSGKAPRFPMPDLALGCLMKPFTAEDVHRSLAMAEDLLRGRETMRPKMPDNLTLYEPAEKPPHRARLHPVQAVTADPARALDFRPPRISTKAASSRGAARAGQRLRGERRAGVEQRLAAALDLGAALDVLEAQQVREARVSERPLDERRRCAASASRRFEPA